MMMSHVEHDVIDGRYLVKMPIGSGASAMVYLCTQQNIGRQVALKILRAEACTDEDDKRRYLREAEVVASLRHPNIVTMFDIGILEDGRPYLVMEYVPGVTLSQLLRKAGPLPPERALPIFEQICAALAAAHSQGVIHRDVKPGNILVEDRSSGFDLVKLADFGVAKQQGQSLTRKATLIGTPAYMAPELFRGAPASAATDIYALGVLMYRSLVGKSPFKGMNDIAVVVQQINEPVPSFEEMGAELPAPIERIVLRCLAKDPSARYAAVEDLIQDIVGARMSLYPQVSGTVSLTGTDLPFTVPPQLITPSTYHRLAGVSLGLVVAGLVSLGIAAALLSHQVGSATVAPPPVADTVLEPPPQVDVVIEERVEAPPAVAPDPVLEPKPEPVPEPPAAPEPPKSTPEPVEAGGDSLIRDAFRLAQTKSPDAVDEALSMLSGSWVGALSDQELTMSLEDRDGRLSGVVTMWVDGEVVKDRIMGQRWARGNGMAVEIETVSGIYMFQGDAIGGSAAGEFRVRDEKRGTWTLDLR